MLRIHTLGRIQAFEGDSPLKWFHSQPRRVALLVFLALDKDVPRELVASVFWPESAPDKARHALNQAVYALRRRIGEDRVIVNGDRLALDATVWVDAVAFDEAVQRGDTAEALRLYGGRFLGSSHLIETAEFESWAARHASALQRQHRLLRRERVAAHIERTELHEALLCAREWAALEPEEDEAHHRVIELLAAMGERTEALQQYHAYVRVLADLGLSPLDETRALASSLEAGEVGAVGGPIVRLGDEPEPPPAAPVSLQTTSKAGGAASRARRPVPARLRTPAYLAAALLVFSVAAWAAWRDRTARPVADAAPGLAILPCAVSGSDPGLWSEGVLELLAMNLDGPGGLRAISVRTVLSRWHERTSATVPDLATYLAVARETEAGYALICTATRFGSSMRLSARVYDVATARELSRAQFDGSTDRIIELVDGLSIRLLTTMHEAGIAAEAVPNLRAVTTASPEALKSYLAGAALERGASFDEARAHYERAVSLDSTFALAWVGIASALTWKGTDLRVGELLARAAGLVNRLTPREVVMMQLRQAFARGDHALIDSARAAAIRYPDDPDVWYQLAEFIWHYGPQALADQQEAVVAFDRAIALDPGFAPYYIHRIEHALAVADTAALSRLLTVYTKVAAPSDPFRRAFVLADAAVRTPQRGLREVAVFADTASEVSSTHANQVFTPYFFYGSGSIPAAPETYEAAELFVLREAQRLRLDPVANESLTPLRLATVSLIRGKVEQAREALDDGMPADGRAVLHYRFHRAGVPLPRGSRDAELAVSPNDSAFAQRLRNFAAGAYAADLKRWAAHAASVRNAEAALRYQRLLGDTAAIREAGAFLHALTAWADIARGHTDRGIGTLETVRLTTGGSQLQGILNMVVRWRIAELHAQQGRYPEALRYFRGFSADPFAQVEMGRMHERMGQAEAARTAYGHAVQTWKDADPGFAQLARARAALARLPSDPR